jgi:hypothetical protein
MFAPIAHNTLTVPFFIVVMVVAKEKGGEAVHEAHHKVSRGERTHGGTYGQYRRIARFG